MYCAVYKSGKREGMYLYLNNKDDFSQVPDALLKPFGQPEFVMVVDLAKREKLAIVDIDLVRADLETKGFFLQLPPSSHHPLS